MPPAIAPARPFPGDDTPDLDAILREVKGACAPHERRLAEARELANYYDGDSEGFIPFRPSEDALSWMTRPKRISYIARMAVNKLTGHLYKPGPRRRRIAADPDVNTWYDRVTKDIHLNSLMQHCDRLATLHGLCAVGVYPTGNPARPINYHLYPRQDFVYWCSSDDPRVPTAVCTISKAAHDPDTIRYRLWTKFAYYTFYKGKAWGYQPGGSFATKYDAASSGPHPYGVLPFAFVTHEIPTTDLETRGLGRILAKINRDLNVDKSNLALWVRHYARPIAFVTGVGGEWRPTIRDGGFVVMPVRHDSTEDAPIIPAATYLESHFDVAAVQAWMIAEANMALAELGLPLALSVANTGGQARANRASGIAIAAEDADLITYAKGRQPIYEVHESGLAQLVCRIGASPPAGMGAFAARLAAVADDPGLRLSWNEPQIDLPGDDRDKADQFELDNGITDAIEIMMRRQGLDEGEAIDQYRSVRYRAHLAAKIDAEAAALVAAAPDVDAAIPTDDRTAEGPDSEDTGAIGSDMGVESTPAPAQLAPDQVQPHVTVSLPIAPNTPIPAAPLVLPASPGFGGMGTEI